MQVCVFQRHRFGGSGRLAVRADLLSLLDDYQKMFLPGLIDRDGNVCYCVFGADC